MPATVMNRLKFTVNGQVQGVGFRPFVFRLAHAHGLSGVVLNSPAGVEIEVQGSIAALQAFEHDLTHALPPLARITQLQKEEIAPLAAEVEFKIIATQQHGQSSGLLVSPDVATCPDCLADINDAANRRHGYSFTNCTNCGPRYTIINALPYDRPFTSLACFAMCPACQKEYQNPADRRFHAQPNACPVCGPQIWLQEPNEGLPGNQGKQTSGAPGFAVGAAQNSQNEAATLRATVRRLLAGEIVAIKGLGGFHLACYACNEQAVATLRERKQRPAKPLAVMVPNLEVAAKLVHLSLAEKEALSSPAAPIVLARKLENSPATQPDGQNSQQNPVANFSGIAPNIAPNIAPGSRTLGLMLPYTPEQHLLLQHLTAELAACSQQIVPQHKDAPLPVLVMTSGNRSSEPIAIGNREALSALRGLADVFLLHNRDILVRADDSVLQVDENGELNFLRRARGFAPQPIASSLTLPANGLTCQPSASSPAPKADNNLNNTACCALGVGAELKNTVCLAEALGNSGSLGNLGGELEINAFVSQHIGDVKDAASESFMRQTEGHLSRILSLRPQVIVRDLHPDYLSCLWAEELGQRANVPVLTLQHHKAHAFSVLFENKFKGPALVLALDGSGLGEDKTIWGGELLLANTNTGEASRLGCLAPTPTPGGDMAAREPWRMAQAYLFKLGQKGAWFESELAEQSTLLGQMLSQNINTPLNTSCGRLFDAVAALLGFGQQQNSLSTPNCSPTASFGAPPGTCSAASNAPGISFEGQAAIWLENLQYTARSPLLHWGATNAATDVAANLSENIGQPYPCPVFEKGDLLVLDTVGLVGAVWEDAQAGVPAARIAQNFHFSLAHALANFAATAARRTGLSTVALSGGVMQSATLRRLLPTLLAQKNLKTLLHQQLPAGDGCISFGQAVWGLLQKELRGI